MLMLADDMMMPIPYAVITILRHFFFFFFFFFFFLPRRCLLDALLPLP